MIPSRLCVRAILAGAMLLPAATARPADLPLETIELPDGFTITVFAEDVPNARSLERSPNGTLFVGSRNDGRVHAVVDEDNDFKADKVYTLAEGLNMPNGVAFRDGSLYVAEVSRVIRYDDIESNLDNPPEPVVVNDSFPTESHHGWKFLDFGPDGKLYLQVGAPCNICNKEDEDERFATIMRMDPDGSNAEVYVRGVRNSVGFTWHPETREMWFTDNGRDMLGDNRPPCELNRVTEMGQHFGYPYCHGDDLPDPEFGDQRPCSDFVPPAKNLGPHVAPLGLTFYTGDQFPDTYKGDLLIAEHGSWNRSIPIGYRVMHVAIEDNTKAVSYEPFAEGWLQRRKAWGRPVDVLQLPDGSVLVSDDKNGVIYRIAYTG